MHLLSKLEDTEQRFMRSSMLLITALVGVRQHVGVYFLPSSSDEAVGTCPQRKDCANAPHAHSITPHLAVREKHWSILVCIPGTRCCRKFPENMRKPTKWWLSCRRWVRRKRHTSAAALKDARSALKKSLRFPPISSFAACLVGQSVQLTHWQ